jgi:15-cis-phytoene synthase
MADKQIASAGDVVRIAARAHERDRYLSALLSPRAARGDLIALAAFAGEVGRIPAYVSEPMMGRIRLQWWRERLETGTSGGHPVAEAIVAAMQRHELPVAGLNDLIEAHEDSLEDRPFATDAALFAYLDRIDGRLFAAAGIIAGTRPDPKLVCDAGRAYGLARLLVETPATLTRGQLLLPKSRTGGDTTLAPPLIRPIVDELGAISRSYLAHCARALRRLSRTSRSPFLPLALVEPYLQACENNEVDRRVDSEVDPLRRAWRLWRCRLTGKV